MANVPQQAIQSLQGGRKVEAIQITQSELGLSLQDAKALVDTAIQADPDLREKYKNLIGLGPTGLTLILLVISAIVLYFILF